MTIYVEPSCDAPLDAEAYLRAIPPGALIKGLFAATVNAAAKQRNLTLSRSADRYLPFLEYPLVDHNRLLLEAAKAFWPELPVRQGLRKIGRAAVTSLLETTFGKALLGGLTNPDTVTLALTSLARAFTTTLSKPTPVVEVIETGPQSAILKMHDVWTFIDSQQVGIIEGLCKLCGVRAHVGVAIDGPASGEFACSWQLAPASQVPPGPVSVR
jgi:uncharacterized protein (TIGR02265 family)